MVIAPAPDSEVTRAGAARAAALPDVSPARQSVGFLRADGRRRFAPALRHPGQDRQSCTSFCRRMNCAGTIRTFSGSGRGTTAIIDDPDNFADNAAAVLCRKHAALQPLAITFYEIQEERYTREDYLSGKKRMDPGFFTIHMLTGHAVSRPMMALRFIRNALRETGRDLVADLVSAQRDGAAGACPHRHRRGAAEPLCAGDALSLRFLGRHRLDAAAQLANGISTAVWSSRCCSISPRRGSWWRFMCCSSPAASPSCSAGARRWVKWIVLIGQISYDHRNPMFFYGVDKILAGLLLILCVAPIGRALSLDRVRAVRAAKRADLDGDRSALQQRLDRGVHPADADPDGGAVLLQRHQQDGRRRLARRRRGVDRVHHRRALQPVHPEPARLAVLAGQFRDLRHGLHRDRLLLS